MKPFIRFLTIANILLNVDSFSVKAIPKQHLLFFPARFQQPLPSEMYNAFISKLKDNYEVHIASNNIEKNIKILDDLQDKYDVNYDNLGFIAHSNGVADLWNVYDTIQNDDNKLSIEKIVLIEPLDLQIAPKLDIRKYIPFIENFDLSNYNFDIDVLNDRIEDIIETDYLQLLKNNIFGTFETTQYCDIDDDCNISNSISGKMLVVKHEQSDKWRFIPTIPPLSFLASDLKEYQKRMNIKEIKIKKFRHFDLLDRPWANMMNRATLDKNTLDEITTNGNQKEYIETIETLIDDFYA